MSSLRRWRFEDTFLLLISILGVSYSAMGFSLFNPIGSRTAPRSEDATRGELIEDTRPVVLHTRWTDYGLWGPCSRTCGSGIKVRTRSCFHQFSNEYLPDADCVGESRQISLCKIQDCPAGVPSDHREEECGRLSTPQMIWRPLYLREDPAMNPCWLGCYSNQAVSWKIVAQEVPDGTPCATRSGSGVCINNECQVYGCDGLVGSSKAKDICGVCDGDGSSCDVVTSSKIVNHLQVGYNEALDIPAGAINIRVLEVRGGKNYLALRERSGQFVINGNYRIDNSRLFVASGSLCSYQRRETRVAKIGTSHTEMFTCSGPVNDTLTVMVLTMDRSPSYLAYEYALPRPHTPTASIGVEVNGGSEDSPREIMSGSPTPTAGSEYTASTDRGSERAVHIRPPNTEGDSIPVDETSLEVNHGSGDESEITSAGTAHPTLMSGYDVSKPNSEYDQLNSTTTQYPDEGENQREVGDSIQGKIVATQVAGRKDPADSLGLSRYQGATRIPGYESTDRDSLPTETSKSSNTSLNTRATQVESGNTAGNIPTHQGGPLEGGKLPPVITAPSDSEGVLSVSDSSGLNIEGFPVPAVTRKYNTTMLGGIKKVEVVTSDSSTHGIENLETSGTDSDSTIDTATQASAALNIDSVTVNPSTAKPRIATNSPSSGIEPGEDEVDVHPAPSEGLIPGRTVGEVVPSTLQLMGMQDGISAPITQPGISVGIVPGKGKQSGRFGIPSGTPSKTIGDGVLDITQSVSEEDIVPSMIQSAVDGSRLRNEVVTDAMDIATHEDYWPSQELPEKEERDLLIVTELFEGEDIIPEESYDIHGGQYSVSTGATEMITPLLTSVDEQLLDIRPSPPQELSSSMSYEWIFWEYPDILSEPGSDLGDPELELNSVHLGHQRPDLNVAARPDRPVKESERTKSLGANRVRGTTPSPTGERTEEELGRTESVIADGRPVPAARIVPMIRDVDNDVQSGHTEDSKDTEGLGVVTQNSEGWDNSTGVPQLRFESRMEDVVNQPVALGASFAELVDPRYANLNISNEISSRAGNVSSQGRRVDSSLLDQNWIPDLVAPSAAPGRSPNEVPGWDVDGESRHPPTLVLVSEETTLPQSWPEQLSTQQPLQHVAPQQTDPTTTTTLGVSSTEKVSSIAGLKNGTYLPVEGVLQGTEGPSGRTSLITTKVGRVKQDWKMIQERSMTTTPPNILIEGIGVDNVIAVGHVITERPQSSEISSQSMMEEGRRREITTSSSLIDSTTATHHLTTDRVTLPIREELVSTARGMPAILATTASQGKNLAETMVLPAVTDSTKTSNVPTSTSATVMITPTMSNIATATTPGAPTTPVAATTPDLTTVATFTPVATTVIPAAMTTAPVATATSPVATTTASGATTTAPPAAPLLTTTPIRVTTLLPATEGNRIAPVAEQPDYVWRRTASSCQVTCGRGIRRDYVYCASRDDAEVADRFCDLETKPDPIPRSCLGQRCEPRWEVGVWSGCSVTCGGGRQFRTVSCWRMEAKGMDALTLASSCVAASGRELPEVQECSTQPCYAEWRVGQWGLCSTQCGEGQRTRTVLCSVAGANRCDLATRPPNMETCHGTRCHSTWGTSPWPQCNGLCQTQMRRVHCYSPSGAIQTDNHCSPQGPKPLSTRLCGSGHCTPRWIGQAWNSDNCGDCQTGYRSRDVSCQMVREGRMDVISEDHCSSLPVPARRSACSECSRQSLPRWYTTRWSACSMSCGGGQKRRKVRCYESGGANTPSSMCDNNFKPLAVASCNSAPCPAVRPRCVDRQSRSHCAQVKRSRLCRYNYYRQDCCQTCRG